MQMYSAVFRGSLVLLVLVMMPESEEPLHKHSNDADYTQNLMSGVVAAGAVVHCTQPEAEYASNADEDSGESLVDPVPSDACGDDAEEYGAAGHDDYECDGEDSCVDDDGPVSVGRLMAVLGGTAAGCDR